MSNRAIERLPRSRPSRSIRSVVTPPASPTPPHRSPSSDSSYDYMANRVLDYIEDNLEYYLSPLPPDFQEYENHINDYFLPEE